MNREPTGRVLVYKTDILPFSETFIRDQVHSYQQWSATLAGLRYTRQLSLSRDPYEAAVRRDRACLVEDLKRSLSPIMDPPAYRKETHCRQRSRYYSCSFWSLGGRNMATRSITRSTPVGYSARFGRFHRCRMVSAWACRKFYAALSPPISKDCGCTECPLRCDFGIRSASCDFGSVFPEIRLSFDTSGWIRLNGRQQAATSGHVHAVFCSSAG